MFYKANHLYGLFQGCPQTHAQLTCMQIFPQSRNANTSFYQEEHPTLVYIPDFMLIFFYVYIKLFYFVCL